jgi:hypothetical protein
MELARVLSKPPAHFSDRNKEKVDAGLDVPAQDKSEEFYEPSTGKRYRVGPNGEKYELPPRTP